VRAEIVKRPWDYKWPSAAAYSGFNDKDPLVVISDHPFRNSMADTEPCDAKATRGICSARRKLQMTWRFSLRAGSQLS